MEKLNNNQVFLLLTAKATQATTDFYRALCQATEHLGDAFILYHQQDQERPGELEKVHHFTFDETKLSELNFVPIGFRLVPGNTHFPLFNFLESNPTYDYYWVIEDDVRFSGDWKYFFDSFSALDTDFLASHIRRSAQEPDWPWWHYLANPYQVIPFEDRLRSFNPIYRLSAKALQHLSASLVAYWSGHYEVMLVTLLREGGFSIADFGGTGEFVLPGYENKFYLSNSPNVDGKLADGTMRYRPVFQNLGGEANKLYHPIKPRVLEE